MKRWIFSFSVKIDTAEDILRENVNLKYKNAHR
jgi:hypothetical protein